MTVVLSALSGQVTAVLSALSGQVKKSRLELHKIHHHESGFSCGFCLRSVLLTGRVADTKGMGSLLLLLLLLLFDPYQSGRLKSDFHTASILKWGGRGVGGGESIIREKALRSISLHLFPHVIIYFIQSDPDTNQ